MKVYAVLTATYALVKDSEVVEELKYFNTKAHPILNTSDVSKIYESDIARSILRDIEECQERESGWTLKCIDILTVHINKYNPMRVGSYIPLPKEIFNRKACINIENDDNK